MTTGRRTKLGDILRRHIKFSLLILLINVCGISSANYNDCPNVNTSNGVQTLRHGQKICAKDADDEKGTLCVLCITGHLSHRRCYKSYGYNRKTAKPGTTKYSICYPVDGYPERRGESKPYPSEECSSHNCKLPNCFCYGARPNIPLSDTPMFVVITFDDGIYKDNYNNQLRPFFVDNDYNLYSPNGCSLKTTLFVSMDGTVTNRVKDLWAAGNEIAGHTADHGLPNGYDDLDYNDTIREIDGMKKILLEESGEPSLVDSINGFRAPYLRVAHETQYKALRDLGYLYDTSLSCKRVFHAGEPIWPYTLDYRAKCDSRYCPKKSYPGMWEVPLNVWIGSDLDYCSMLDYCNIGRNTSSASVNDWLQYFKYNFEISYRTKTPLSFYSHTHVFDRYPNSFLAFGEWLKCLTKNNKDVWFVTIQQLLLWMKHPLTTKQMVEMKWGCG